MKTRIIVLLVLLAIPVLTTGGSVTAREPEPWSHHTPGFKRPKLDFDAPYLNGSPDHSPDDLWTMPADTRPMREAADIYPLATGGPDDYGYTWNDTVPFNWIDATTGTDTGLAGDDQFSGPFNIGFPFKFYENTYTQFYVSTNGVVSFGQGVYEYSNQDIPNPSLPNNFIAPFWDDLCVNCGGYNTGKVYYLQGGTAPNRYVVIEWYQVSRLGSSNLLTFEVILYESGSIVMQYLSLSGDLTSATVGIEDDIGTTGLKYLYNASGLANNRAVRFYRPVPSARIKAYPFDQGRFTRAGATESFQVFIRNTGELGADTYDLTVSSAWPVTLYAANGSTPLTDTDGDGTIDTGSLVQGSTFTVTVKVQTPATGSVGDDNTANITARSSLNTGKSKSVALQTAIPAPFAQAYGDNIIDGVGNLYLVQPAGQAVKKVVVNSYYSPMAVAEMPGSNFVYLHNPGRCLNINCDVFIGEIAYSLLDRYGNTIRAVTKLTNHSGATMTILDYNSAVAVAPNGRIGVIWQRYLWNDSISRYNYNLWFAILDSAGHLAYGPVNLTNNNAWGNWSDYGVPLFYAPRIAATGDNRFVLAWVREHRETSGEVEDIYYAVRDSSGGEVGTITKLTNDTPGASAYYDPALASLSGNRVFLSWSSRQAGNDDIYYAVIGSNGSLVKTATDLSVDETVVDWRNHDAVQLSNGRIIAVWEAWGCVPGEWVPRIRFALLDTAYNRIGMPVCLGKASAAISGDTNVSVAADAAGRAILTWMDDGWNNRRNLYYALVDGNGSILTPPMIFRASQATSPYIETNHGGYGNTSYSWTPPAGVDGRAAFSASLFGGAPGDNVGAGIRIVNHGVTSATNVVLTATLGGGLTYVGDTSGITPTVNGNSRVWNLPHLSLLADFNFTLYVQTPSAAAYGTRYPITLTLTSAGPEVNPSDNTAYAEVMAARQSFLPVILKGY